MMDVLAALGLGYLLGSIPFGLILTRWAGVGDLRAIGSGNIGATNVLRTGRRGLAAATLALDAAKAALAVVVAQAMADGMAAPVAAGLGAWAGHVFPVWLRFRGGKGVAVALGAAFALSAWAGLGFVLAWLGGMLASRRSSVGGMLAPAGAGLAALAAGHGAAALAMGGLLLGGLWAHRANVVRLRDGTEPRIGRG